MYIQEDSLLSTLLPLGLLRRDWQHGEETVAIDCSMAFSTCHTRSRASFTGDSATELVSWLTTNHCCRLLGVSPDQPSPL